MPSVERTGEAMADPDPLLKIDRVVAAGELGEQ